MKEMTDSIIDAITSEPFLKRMEEIRKLPMEERLMRARDILSVDGLREAGVSMPEGMRISSRYFEEDLGVLEFGNVDEFEAPEANSTDPKITLKDGSSIKVAPFPGIACYSEGPVVMGTCGGAGAGTVCGCGGSC
ncbi:hypothetical protein [Paracoccus sp. SSK6]|uniref:hypothetical protein n=1 Tax=Paracoccus sp. SSK6 TaxID=3143131 RepID=UPI00321AB0E4